jgi:hypothetical protein
MTKVREPSSIVEMAEMCRKALLLVPGLLDAEQADIEAASNTLNALNECDFYQIDESVGRAADQVYENTFGGKKTEELVLDSDCRLPSNVCAFWSPGTKITFEGRTDNLPFMYFAITHRSDPGKCFVYLVSPYFAPMFQGYYEIGVADSLRINGRGDDITRPYDQQIYSMHTLTVAAMCSILNQPGFTKKEPAGSRQERRAAKRSGSYAIDAWHKITWNIGEEVKAKLTRDEPVRCMPLHYTRGHWRKAEEGWKNTTQRKDGLWYQWIEGFWSGHPAFGIKKSYHAPKMGDAA